MSDIQQKKITRGIGLNNVLNIVEKYPNNMMVDINTEAGWFTFNLVVVK